MSSGKSKDVSTKAPAQPDFMDPDHGVTGQMVAWNTDRTVSPDPSPGIQGFDLFDMLRGDTIRRREAKRPDDGVTGVRKATIMGWEKKLIGEVYDEILFAALSNFSDITTKLEITVVYACPAGGLCACYERPRDGNDWKRIRKFPRFYSLEDFGSTESADWPGQTAMVEILDPIYSAYGVFHGALDDQNSLMPQKIDPYEPPGPDSTVVQSAFSPSPGTAVSTIGGKGVPGATPAPDSSAGGGVPSLADYASIDVQPLDKFVLYWWGPGMKIGGQKTPNLPGSDRGTGYFTKVYDSSSTPTLDQFIMNGDKFVIKHKGKNKRVDFTPPEEGWVGKLINGEPYILAKSAYDAWLTFLASWSDSGAPGTWGLHPTRMGRHASPRAPVAKYATNLRRTTGTLYTQSHNKGYAIDIMYHGPKVAKADKRAFCQQQIHHLRKAGFTNFGMGRWYAAHADMRPNRGRGIWFYPKSNEANWLNMVGLSSKREVHKAFLADTYRDIYSKTLPGVV